MNCTKFANFGQFIFEKILKIVAIRSHILKLKCTKFDFGRGSAPDPAEGAHSAPHAPSWILEGPTSNGRKGEGNEKEREKRGKRERAGREGTKRERGGKEDEPSIEIYG